MPWHASLDPIQTILADLYPTEDAARRVVDQAGLNAQQIDFDGPAINRWHNILLEAERQGSVHAILAVAQAEYPRNQALSQAAAAYRPLPPGFRSLLVTKRRLGVGVALVLLVLALAALPGLLPPRDAPSPTATPTQTPSPTATPTASPTPTPSPLPRMGDGQFNIAVAEFTALDPAGRPLLANQVPAISAASIAHYLEGETETFREITGQRAAVWGPEQGIQPVAPGAEAARAAAHNAHVLLYGTLRARADGRFELAPAFFVADPSIAQANELLGEHALGTPLLFQPESTASMRDLNAGLERRLRALLQLLIGLSYFEQGTEAGYQQATQMFQEATRGEWGQAGDGTGQEILYLFLGSSYLQQLFYAEAHDATQEARAGLLEKARDAYATGREMNPRYPRIYNGLGIVLFQLARLPSLKGDFCDWTWELLDEARERYQQALEVLTPDDPAADGVQITAHLGLGRIAYTRGLCQGLAAELDAARDHYTTVIQAFEATPRPFLVAAAMAAHSELANSLLFTLDALPPEQAAAALPQIVDHYRRAVALGVEAGTPQGLDGARLIMPYLLVALCRNGQPQEIAPTLDQFSDRFPEPAQVREEILSAFQLPEGCRYEEQP